MGFEPGTCVVVDEELATEILVPAPLLDVSVQVI